jgi:nicotinamidase/pyrazinamidase
MNTVYFDVDTQFDFMLPAGALYAPGAEMIAENLKTLTRSAALRGCPVISTADAHTENDPEFQIWKPHCVLGTVGQQKLSGTLLDRRYTLSTGADTLDPQAARASQQIILEKQNVNCFTNAHLLPLLDLLGAKKFIVYGVVTEVCVLHAAEGLLQAGYDIEIVSDAIWAFSPAAGQEALQNLTARGAKLITTARVAA